MTDESMRSWKAPAYEDRCLAFVDVLGWSNIVRKSVQDPSALEAIHRAAELIVGLRTMAERANRVRMPEIELPPLDARVSHFSDTFVFSMPAVADIGMAFPMMLRAFCRTLLGAGHYTRGAIVCGLVHHTDRALYGPAVIEAYELERSTAVYPRILITPGAQRYFPDPGILRTDHDGLVCLDLLHTDRSDVRGLEKLAALVAKKEKEDQADLHLLAKHRWMARYVADTLLAATEPGDGATKSGDGADD
jgi:hypothetical protein